MGNRLVKQMLGGVLAVILCCFFSPAFSAAAGSDLLVDTAFLKDKIGKPGWVIMDMR